MDRAKLQMARECISGEDDTSVVVIRGIGLLVDTVIEQAERIDRLEAELRKTNESLCAHREFAS